MPGHLNVAIRRVRNVANLSIEDLDLGTLKPIDREVQEFLATGSVPLQQHNQLNFAFYLHNLFFISKKHELMLIFKEKQG